MGAHVDDRVAGLLAARGVGVGEVVETAFVEGAHTDARTEAAPHRLVTGAVV